MKTRFYWVALIASAALIAPVHAGGGNHGGGGGGGRSFAAAGPGPARSSGGPSFRSMPVGNFGGGRMIYSGQRFSSVGMRSPGYRQQYINPNGGATVRARQFTPGNINRADRVARFSNRENRGVANARRSGNAANQIRSGNSLPMNWRSHVVAQHSGNWQRNWDRSRDHAWHGHHCRFINGSWVIFDFGFYPWWPYWYYPYDYYADDYYPYQYGYDPGYYDSSVYQNEESYGQHGYGNANADSTIAAAQQQLAREGYYRGQIDGILGPGTRAAIAEYQSNHGLHVTGALSSDTLQALGLRPS